MITILKTITHKKVGFKINNYNNSKRLSEIISIETGIELNYNTIRRFFGVVKSVKPSNHTLDTLSKLNGYENYNDFIINYSYKNKWESDFKFFELLQKNDDERVLNYVTDHLHHGRSFLLKFVHLVRELILTKNYKLLSKVFSLKEMNPSEFIFEDIIYLGTCIGPLCHHIDLNQKSEQQLILNRNFQNIVTLIYVDYENLEGYYSQLIRFIYKNSKDTEIKVFCEGVLNLNIYLNNNPKKNFFVLTDQKQFHPILKSRIVAQELFYPEVDHLKILEDYSLKNQLKTQTNIDYFFEIIFNSIVTKNFGVMKWIIDNLTEFSTSKSFYKFEHYENFVLMNLLYYCKIEDRNSCEIWLGSISFNNFNRSYEKLFQQYVYIFKYHYYSTGKKSQLEAYTKANKNMYKNFFSTSYFLEYFS
tara:strand:- start:35159 stop:36409 length:1251 start_codon:yes stop_codon:yes gene_type:complete